MEYQDLRGIIRAKYGTQEAFARAMNMHPTTLSGKLSGKSDWTRGEIACAAGLLGLSMVEVVPYFYPL